MAPTELDVAMIVVGAKEQGWYATMIDAVGRLAEDNPNGLTIILEVVEGIAFADDERVVRDLAQTGEYEIILGHSTHSDAIAAIKDDFPDTLFAFSGSGNDPLGGNGYWIDVFIHEPAYLAGIIAGMIRDQPDQRRSGLPVPQRQRSAQRVHRRSEVGQSRHHRRGHIESWFDPATAHEAAAAQIAAGSDMIYAERFGTFAAAEEAGNVRVFGHFTDQLDMSDVVVTSAVAR